MEVTHAIRNKIDSIPLKQPGKDGAFGSLVSSHDIINNIGGPDDTNSNTTLRILLLLESISIGCPDAYDRVFNNILYRYVDEDRGLWKGSGPYRVPRFMFNDIARCWRTITVDFAYKQRSRNNEGFAIRSLKLRMSRKLLFLAGMMACFECHVSFSSDCERIAFYSDRNIQAVIDKLKAVLIMPPLEIVARSLTAYQQFDDQSKLLFDAYDEFLGMLADIDPRFNGKSFRDHLENLPLDDLQTDSAAILGRDVSHRFGSAIRSIFLNDKTLLGELTTLYGVF